MNFFSIMKFLAKGDKTLFDVAISKQRAFLESLPNPRDDMERSFFQYKAQSLFTARWKIMLLNIVGLLAFFPVLLCYLFRNITIQKKERREAITDLRGMEEVIPLKLKQCYDIAFIRETPTGALQWTDLPFVLNIFFRFFPFGYFSFKAMAKIAQYSQLIWMYSPTCIIAHLEYSFSSSLLSLYSERKGVKHINIMHGEKLYYIRDSFFRFSKCYVWDEHYMNLFLSLRAASGQFKIEIPPSLQINPADFINEDVYADVKYYLGETSDKEFASIVQSLSPFRDKGFKVKYRLHPRYSNRDMLLKYCAPKDLEDPKTVSIQDSISNVKYVVSSYSTVLLQAWFAGQKIILDDVTYVSAYHKLITMQYILSTKPHFKLSEINRLL